MFKVGPFTVHNTLALSESELDDIKTAIASAAKLARKTGISDFHKVLYGDVFVTGKVYDRRSFAVYFREGDDIYLRPITNGQKGPAFNLLHELAHRYWQRFADKAKKSAWYDYHRNSYGAPTPYAATDPEERFCETVALAAMGRLKGHFLSDYESAWGSRTARGKAKKDVGHGGLDEWFSGHGGAKGKGEDATWGDWVAISPVKKTLDSGKKVEPGDIVGPCGISEDPDWKDVTDNGKSPLKCMPRQKAHDTPKKERAEKAKGKQRAEKKNKGRGKEPTMTPTFDKKAFSGSRVFRSPKPFTSFRSVGQKGPGFKPQGLWYSCGSEWDDWCRFEMPEWITKSPYVYEIEINPSQMVIIRNSGDFLEFEQEFGVDHHGMRVIDWGAVARKYAGIEICPYQSKFRMSSMWYYSWDVASGCIWGSGAFKSVEPVETCGVGRVAHLYLQRQADSDGSYMSVQHLRELQDHSSDLLEKVESDTPLEDWVEAKLTESAAALRSVYEFMEHGRGSEQAEKLAHRVAARHIAHGLMRQ